MNHNQVSKHDPQLEKWKQVELSAILRKIATSVTVKPDQHYREIGVRSHGKGLFHKDPVTGSSLGDKRVYHVQPDCFVVNVVFAWEQAIAITSQQECGMIASHRFPMYQPIGDQVDLRYLLSFFQSKKGKHLLGLASPGGAGRNRTLGQAEFMGTCIPLPPIGEQQRIANILSTWDRAIELTEKLIAAKQKRKQALIQQLLTGKLRLPGFGVTNAHGIVPVGWQRIPLSDFVRRTAGAIQWADNVTDMPCIELEHISQRTGRLLGTTMLSSQSSMKNLFRAGQVLFGKLRPNLRKFVIAPCDGACSTEIWVLDSVKDRCINQFLFYLVQAKPFYYASLVTSGSKMPRADWQIISDIDFMVPPLDEQRAIAAVLNTQDREIELLQKKLDALRRQKKGLMQQLLTGKVRVQVPAEPERFSAG